MLRPRLKKRDSAAIKAKATALRDAFHDLQDTIQDQRRVEASSGSPSAVTSYDNALEKLDNIDGEIESMAIELFAAFYFRGRAELGLS